MCGITGIIGQDINQESLNVDLIKIFYQLGIDKLN